MADKLSSVSSAAERKNLLDLAVKFLTNPKVADKPQEAKITFLKKKGLTDEEVEWAIRQAEVVSPTTAPPLPPSPLLPPVGSSYTWKQVAVGGVIVGGVVGVVLYWIKSFLDRWISGQQSHEQRLESVESTVQQIQSNNDTIIRELQESTQAIQALLEKQQTQLTGLVTRSSSPVIAEQTFKSIQTEISTLKGLLLNRHQFPSFQKNPSSPGGIPAWQRPPQQEDTLAPHTSSSTSLSHNKEDTQEEDEDDRIVQ